MARSQQSFLKREKEAKKKNKKKEKEEKKEARKSTSNKGKGFDSMIAYVDEKGQLSSTPPDPSLRQEMKLEDIQLGANKNNNDGGGANFTCKGRISYYNEDKGYGFITDNGSGDSFFFHLSHVMSPVQLNSIVTFQKAKGPKGMIAISVNKAD